MASQPAVSPVPPPARPVAPAWLDREAYPFTLRSLTVPQGRLSYVDEGAGDPLLFVHGTPTWSFEYRHLIRALSADHRCIAVDNLGFGLSDRPPGFDYRPQSHAAVLAAFVDGLGLDHFTLVTHDYGVPFALPLALDRPDRLRSLILLNSWMWRLDDDPDFRRAARLVGGRLGRFLYRRLNFSLRVLLPHAWGDRRTLTPAIHRQYLTPFPDADSRGRVLWPLARGLLDAGDHFDSLWQRRSRLVDLPTLVMWGMKDRALPPRLLDRWRQALPSAEVIELPHAGHWPHEETPTAVLTHLRRFLGSRRAVASR
jgi:haloalkane dehalogenase